MAMSRQDRILVAVAKYYYDDGLSQAEVAERVGVSRSNISRMLQSARDRGIVQIIVHDPDERPQRVPELEQRILDRYQIQEAIVVRTPPYVSAVQLVGKAGADWVAESVQSAHSVGISWGRTMQRLVEQLPQTRLPFPVTIRPLVGGLNTMDSVESGYSVVQLLARKLGTRAERFYAPAVVSSEAAYSVLTNEPEIRNAIEAAAKVELGIVGIGTFGLHASSEIISRMALSGEEYEQVLAQSPVGDICGQFYDAMGKPLGLPTSTRTMSVSIEQLRGIPRLLGVAAGAEKAPGVHGALNTRAINALAIDSNLAEALLSVGAHQPG